MIVKDNKVLSIWSGTWCQDKLVNVITSIVFIVTGPSKWRCFGSLPWYPMDRVEMRLTPFHFSDEEREALSSEDTCPVGSGQSLGSGWEEPSSPLPLCLPPSLLPLGRAPRAGMLSKMPIKTHCYFMVCLFAPKDIKSKLIKEKSHLALLT